MTTIFSGFAKAEEKAGEKTIGIGDLKSFSGAFQGIWQGAVGVWNKIFEGVKNFWNKHIKPFFINLWNKEIKIKRPEIKEELEKEKEEIKTEIPKASKTIWGKFKDLIKWWKE